MDSNNSLAPAQGIATRVLDFDQSPVVLLNFLSNRLVSTASAVYRQKFQLGIADVRLLTILACEPNISPARVSEVIGLDTAQISRALQVLKQRGLVRSLPDPRHPRYARWYLTEEGARVQDDVAEIAINRSQALMNGVAPEDQEICLRALRVMLHNVAQFPRTKGAK